MAPVRAPHDLALLPLRPSSGRAMGRGYSCGGVISWRQSRAPKREQPQNVETNRVGALGSLRESRARASAGRRRERGGLFSQSRGPGGLAPSSLESQSAQWTCS